MPVAPNFQGVIAGEFGVDDLAAHGGGGFFAPALECAMRAVDVVETRHPALHAPVFAEVAAHALAEELFPAVPVFGHGGIRIGFLEINVGGFAGLLIAVV